MREIRFSASYGNQIKHDRIARIITTARPNTLFFNYPMCSMGGPVGRSAGPDQAPEPLPSSNLDRSLEPTKPRQIEASP